MTDNHLSHDVLDKIKKEHITPKPRWEFLLKDSAVWTAGVAALLVGSAAVSVIIHTFRNDDFDILIEAGDKPIQTVLILMPYFWIAALAAFILIAHYNFKQTKGGYRYRIPTVLVAAVLISAALGVFLYDAGAGRAIDHLLADRLPAYGRFMVHPRMRMWSRPESNMIAGTVLEINNYSSFRLRDFEEHDWTIEIPGEPPFPLPPFVKPNARIRCLCKTEGPNLLKAMQLFPWDPQLRPIFRFMDIMHERTEEPAAY